MKTPTFLIDTDVLKRNIEKVQDLANNNNKKLCPMTKTHKSSKIAKMQIEAGADSLLVGTIDEGLAFKDLGVDIVFAYPIVNKLLLSSVETIPSYTLSVDSIEGCKIYEENFNNAEVLVIVDVGLHRLGVCEELLLDIVNYIKTSSILNLKGIASHAGQVYKGSNKDEVKLVAQDELNSLKKYYEILKNSGYENLEVCSGTTPTFFELVETDFITTFRPGNYVFYDSIQVALGVCIQSDCALTVVGSVISNPEVGKYILDIGSKTLGLDKGAHGNSALAGYGIIKGLNAVLDSLSEEVSILYSKDKLQLGDVVEVIPNHSCSTNNMTSTLYDKKKKLQYPLM